MRVTRVRARMDAISVPSSSILSSALFVREGLSFLFQFVVLFRLGIRWNCYFFFTSVAKVCKDVGKIVLGF